MLVWSIIASAWRSASKRAITCSVSMPTLMTFSATRRQTGSLPDRRPEPAPPFAQPLQQLVRADRCPRALDQPSRRGDRRRFPVNWGERRIPLRRGNGRASPHMDQLPGSPWTRVSSLGRRAPAAKFTTTFYDLPSDRSNSRFALSDSIPSPILGTSRYIGISRNRLSRIKCAKASIPINPLPMCS